MINQKKLYVEQLVINWCQLRRKIFNLSKYFIAFSFIKKKEKRKSPSLKKNTLDLESRIRISNRLAHLEHQSTVSKSALCMATQHKLRNKDICLISIIIFNRSRPKTTQLGDSRLSSPTLKGRNPVSADDIFIVGRFLLYLN